MQTHTLFLAAAALVALLHFWWIPLLERASRASRGPRLVARSTMLAFFGCIKALAVIATVSSAVVAGGIALVEARGGATAAEVARAMASVADLRDAVGVGQQRWAILAVVALIVGLALLSLSRGRLAALNGLRRAYHEQFARLQRDRYEGRLKYQPPTDAMLALEKEFVELENFSRTVADTGIRLAAEERMRDLRRAIDILDLERRMEFEWVPGVPRRRRRWIGKLEVLLTSRAWLASIKGPRCQGSCRLVRRAAGPLAGRQAGQGAARLPAVLLPAGQDAPHGGRAISDFLQRQRGRRRQPSCLTPRSSSCA